MTSVYPLEADVMGYFDGGNDSALRSAVNKMNASVCPMKIERRCREIWHAVPAKNERKSSIEGALPKSVFDPRTIAAPVERKVGTGGNE